MEGAQIPAEASWTDLRLRWSLERHHRVCSMVAGGSLETSSETKSYAGSLLNAAVSVGKPWTGGMRVHLWHNHVKHCNRGSLRFQYVKPLRVNTKNTLHSSDLSPLILHGHHERSGGAEGDGHKHGGMDGSRWLESCRATKTTFRSWRQNKNTEYMIVLSNGPGTILTKLMTTAQEWHGALTGERPLPLGTLPRRIQCLSRMNQHQEVAKKLLQMKYLQLNNEK